MEIILLVVGLLLLLGAVVIIIRNDGDLKQFTVFGLTISGTICILACSELRDRSKARVINQSELSDRKITITITNEKDTICDTTYIYEPKR